MTIACLDLPALPLQLVWRREPTWREHPVVVIDEDRPQGRVQWACERARQAGVLVGQRYAHALSLCAGLRARVVPPEQIEAAVAELRTALHKLSPRVEPGEPGTFWLDGEGLERIFEDRPGQPRGSGWGAAIVAAALALGLRGAVVVGTSRFSTYAIAREVRVGVVVLPDPDRERARASAVLLARLEVEPKLREALARLGVTTVGQMVRLPGGGILERFGREAHRLYQLAAGERWVPIVPVAPPEAPDERVLLDEEDDDVDRLMFALKGPLDRLLARLAARGRALAALHVELALKYTVGRVEPRTETIRPAAPTLDGRSLAGLARLRLVGAPPAAPVNAIRVWADDVAATREQLALFAARPRRDLRAADEALARVRAELGDDAVVRAVLRDGHLPEASFGWERLVHAVHAAPTAAPAAAPTAAPAAAPTATPTAARPLVRRLLPRPQPLPPQARQVRDDGWLLTGLEHGSVLRIKGPYIVSGGWWAGEVHREYHFAELRRGDCLWVYYDRNRRRWFWQGGVE
jgi:protein ImuB